MNNKFYKLDISDKEAEKISEEFDSFMDLATVSGFRLNEIIDVPDEKVGEVIRQARSFALDSEGGFQKSQNYDPQKGDSSISEIPVEGLKDVDHFRTWLSNNTTLSVSSAHNYRNALRRFYFFTSEEYSRTEKIDLRENMDELKEQLEAFVVSNNNELGMKKYMKFYGDENPEQEEKAKQLKKYIHGLDYDADEELSVSLN